MPQGQPIRPSPAAVLSSSSRREARSPRDRERLSRLGQLFESLGIRGGKGAGARAPDTDLRTLEKALEARLARPRGDSPRKHARIVFVALPAAFIWFHVWEPFARVSVIGVLTTLRVGCFRLCRMLPVCVLQTKRSARSSRSV